MAPTCSLYGVNPDVRRDDFPRYSHRIKTLGFTDTVGFFWNFTTPGRNIYKNQRLSPHRWIRLSSPLRGLFGRLQLWWLDGRCVQDPRTYSPRPADPRLLPIPTSWGRVADLNLNWGEIYMDLLDLTILLPFVIRHCRVCVTQVISAVLTWRHPFLPPPLQKHMLLK